MTITNNIYMAMVTTFFFVSACGAGMPDQFIQKYSFSARLNIEQNLDSTVTLTTSNASLRIPCSGFQPVFRIHASNSDTTLAGRMGFRIIDQGPKNHGAGGTISGDKNGSIILTFGSQITTAGINEYWNTFTGDKLDTIVFGNCFLGGKASAGENFKLRIEYASLTG
ncbi:Uncharacterised protein [Serratia fonticola]|jgi:hypothetical protein|uniref:hypothetical protein n=1 Tax=Serratia fonticola TaxID=47917 RepID=UPI002178343D|nr:hypothetical protein [Serratia fonticola]CAI1747315.1 Uncharacterised protein [Serratia fonticola]